MLRLLSGALLITTGVAVLTAGCGYTLIPHRNRRIAIRSSPGNSPPPSITQRRSPPFNWMRRRTWRELLSTRPPREPCSRRGCRRSPRFSLPRTRELQPGTASVTLVVNVWEGARPRRSMQTSRSAIRMMTVCSSISAPLSSGMGPAAVLGQKDFTSSDTSESAGLLVGPRGLGIDGAGNLYVADATNCRIIRFPPPFTTAKNADLEIGVPSFTSPGSWPRPAVPDDDSEQQPCPARGPGSRRGWQFLGGRSPVGPRPPFPEPADDRDGCGPGAGKCDQQHVQRLQ